jgi:Ca2+-transporting ATPase
MVVEFDVLRRLLGTTRLHGSTQWTLAVAPAVALFILWELGKLIARSRQSTSAAPASAQSEG